MFGFFTPNKIRYGGSTYVKKDSWFELGEGIGLVIVVVLIVSVAILATIFIKFIFGALFLHRAYKYIVEEFSLNKEDRDYALLLSKIIISIAFAMFIFCAIFRIEDFDFMRSVKDEYKILDIFFNAIVAVIIYLLTTGFFRLTVNWLTLRVVKKRKTKLITLYVMSLVVVIIGAKLFYDRTEVSQVADINTTTPKKLDSKKPKTNKDKISTNKKDTDKIVN